MCKLCIATRCLAGVARAAGEPLAFPGAEGLGAKATGGRGAKTLIADHCSPSWSTDWLSDAVRGSRDVTIQWCILAEPLTGSVHVKGAHGHRTGWSHGSYQHNLIAHCDGRAPRLGSAPERGTIDFVANAFRPGPSSKHNDSLFNAWDSDSRIFRDGNLHEGNPALTADNHKDLIARGWSGPARCRSRRCRSTSRSSCRL